MSIWTLSGVANYDQVLETLSCNGRPSTPVDHLWRMIDDNQRGVFKIFAGEVGVLKAITQQMYCKSSEHPGFQGLSLLTWLMEVGK